MAVNDLVITIKANDQASKALNGIKSKVNTFATGISSQVNRTVADTKVKMASMAQTVKKNWLVITAAITASFIALRKAFDLIKLAATFNQQEEAFRNFAAKSGQNAEELISQMKRLSGETLSTATVMQNATRAMALGLSADKLPRLMEISRAAARAFGEDVSFMFDSIVLGLGRQSRMILDNLGIIIKQDEANRRYAESMGIVGRALNEEEKKIAFLNEALRQGQNIIDTVNIQNKSQLEGIQSLAAAWDNLKVAVGNALLFIIQANESYLQIWNSLVAAIVGGVTDAFEFMNEKLAVAVEFYGNLLDKLPFVDESFKDLTLTLEENALFWEGAGNASQDYGNKATETAFLIAEMMQSKATPAMSGFRQAVETVSASTDKLAKDSKKNMKAVQDAIGTSLAQSIVHGKSWKETMSGLFKQWATAAIKEIIRVIFKLEALKKAMDAISGGPLGFIKGFFGFADGGIVGSVGNKLNLPTAANGASVARGRAVPILAHEGEFVGTPARLAEAGIGGGSVEINIGEVHLGGDQDVTAFAEDLGFRVEQSLRSARGLT